MISPLLKVGDWWLVVSDYIAFLNQSFNSFSMLIIPWSYLSVKLSSFTGLRSLGCCCITIILITWYLLSWSSIVIISVTYHLLTWSPVLKFQVTCCLSTWSSSTWVFLITCHLSAWSSIMWSWFKVENINKISLSISFRPLRRSKNFDFFILESCCEDGPS